MALLQQNDILFAHKALNLMPGLSATTRRVAGAIIDCFNKRTGQCDPSIGGLIKQLRVSRAAVIRATDELDKLGWIRKDIHGGLSHRNAYLPNWDQLRKFVEDWDREKRAGSIAKRAKSKVSKLQPSQPQTCDSAGLRNETQTLLKNKSNKLIEVNCAETHAPPSSSRNKGHDPARHLKKDIPDDQRTFLRTVQGSNKKSRSNVVRNQAQQRWERDLMKQDLHCVEKVMDWLNEAKMALITEAELNKQGGGLEYIFKAHSP